MTLLFLTVMPSPYQRQLFTALAETPGMDIAARYFTGGAHDRAWKLPDMHPYEKVMPGRTLSRLGPSAHWNPEVMAEIDAINPDLVVVSDYSAPTAQLVMRRLARGKTPFVFWGEVPGFSKRGAVGSFLRRRLQAPLGAAAGIAGMGSVAVEAYQALYPGKPVFNIPYVCDLGPYRAARAAAEAAGDTEKDTIDILFSGQMIHRKGVDVLIDAFARVAPNHPKLRLLLLGGGPEQETYAARVPEALKPRVIFLGHRDPADLPGIFARADVFCLPSRHDGWGVVVNEALGAGLPQVVSDAVGAGPDLVIPGENGMITPVGEVAPLALALEQLAGDDALRTRMAARATEMAAHWNVDEGARRWRAAAKTLLSKKATA